jgi:hypothetical protein
MKLIVKGIAALFFLSLGWISANAQCIGDESGCRKTIPHFLKFAGTLKQFSGASTDRVVALKFAIYSTATGGSPLWQEIQNSQLDSQGHYEVMLGTTATDGIPLDLFSAGESRWLGVQPVWPGEVEQPRVMLVSVPYAMEAANAQTLGGLPASAFAKVASTNTAEIATASPTPTANGAVVTSATSSSTANSAATANAPASVVAALTTPPPPSSIAAVRTQNTVPKFAAGGALQDSQITDLDGVVALRNLENTIFADRFPNGVSDAVAACPASGCIIYAASPNVNLNLGFIDPGTKAITIYLGPYVYRVNQITLRKALKIIGMGAAGGVNGSPTCSVALPCSGTTLQSVNGNNPVFVIPQTNNTPATNVLLSGFRILGSAGNTNEDGFFLDTSSSLNTGLWYSTLDDIYLEGFRGIAIHVKGRNNDFASATQWILFNNVVVFRMPGGANALRLEGATFELRFRNCEFDGQAVGDGTNIYIGGVAGGTSGYPTSLVFEGLVSQRAALAVQMDGGLNLTFYGSHHELLFNGYQITDNTNIGTRGVTISDSYFAGNVGINGGAGFDLNVATSNVFGVVFAHNQIFGPPDSVVKSTNLASVVYQDNLYYAGNLPPTAGLTTQMSPATTINILGVHTIGLNPSATPITTINSGLGPGEMVTFFVLGSGSVTFHSGGNIDLAGMMSLPVTGTVTMVRSDLGGLLWKIVSQWNPTLPPTTPTATAARAQKTASPGVAGTARE